MIDHHVDRPGVEVQRCTKLTGPNRPTGSISSRHAQHAAVGSRQLSVVSYQTRQQMKASLAGPQARHKTIARALAKQARGRTGTSFTRPRGRRLCGAFGDGLDDLVALAGGPHPIPSRTRP